MKNPTLVIVGAGPAGVAGALWAKSQEISPIVLERASQPGGQLHHVYFHPSNLPGVLEGDGAAIAASYARQLSEEGGDVRYGAAARSLEPDEQRPAVHTSNGDRVTGDAVLIASGVRRRRLEVPGERELEDHGVSFSATRDRDVLAGRRVVVIGGGDAAYENALKLAKAKCDVVLAVRDAPRARRAFRERVAADLRIELLEGTHVVAFHGARALEAVELENANGRFVLEATGAVVKIGVIPNTEWCREHLDHDTEGHLVIDARGRTSGARVWAAGDVTAPLNPSIAVALGQAATAIADIRISLVG